MPGSRPGSTAVLVVAAAIVASYFAVAFDRQDNRAEPPTTTLEAPVPTITTDQFVAQVVAAVADELGQRLTPRQQHHAQERVVDVVGDRGSVVIVAPPPPTTTTSTTTTTTPPPASVPSVADFSDAWDHQDGTEVSVP